jgi:hypothetical protein
MCILYIFLNSSGGQMGIKDKKKVTFKPERRSIRPVEDWAEDITKSKLGI